MSKQAIKVALLDLMEERPLNSISVRLLCKTADVNRSTFYAHYADIFTLLDEMEEEYLAHTVFANLSVPNKDYRKQLEELVRYLKENRRFVLLMLKNDRLLPKMLEHSWKTNYQPHRAEVYSMLVTYSVCGSVSAIFQWLEHPDSLSEDEIVQILYDCSRSITVAGKHPPQVEKWPL